MSLARNASLIHIKKSSLGLKQRIPSLLDQYKKGSSIVQLAKETTYSPYLLARYIVEEISTCKENKKALSAVMKDPEGMLSNFSAISPAYQDVERNDPILQNDGERDGYVFRSSLR
jgi:hypothetical protein